MALNLDGSGLLSSFNQAITAVGQQSDDATNDANSLISSESMTTENMLAQLKQMYEQQERVSFLSQMIKSLHEMNQQVIQSLK